VTFRPEQKEWKSMVRPAPVEKTDDPSLAARRVMSDDGMNIGVLYAGNRPCYELDYGRAPKSVSDLEMEFRV
jgi:2-oxoglutarate ferredoxin oxidoreductase subunit beta